MAERKRLSPAEKAAALRKAKTRQPIGGLSVRLGMPKMVEDGWTLHWFNKTPERIQQAKAAGYEPVQPHDVQGGGFVNSTSVTELTRSNATGIDATGSETVCMKIPTEIWEEDQKANADAKHEKWWRQIEGNQFVGDSAALAKDNNFYNNDSKGAAVRGGIKTIG